MLESISFIEDFQIRKRAILFQIYFTSTDDMDDIIITDYVSFSWEIKEVSAEPGGLPFVYLYKSTILIFSILLLMQSFANILSYFSDD